jgi:hypothetical protein
MHAGVREDPEGALIAYSHYASLKAEVERLTAFTTRTIIPNEELQAQVERLKTELKFAEHRMISLAEALADTRLGYQKKIEILKDKRCNRKCDQGSHKANNKGKPSRPGGKGEIIGDKPQESGGAY